MSNSGRSERFLALQKWMKERRPTIFPRQEFLDWVYATITTLVVEGYRSMQVSLQDMQKVTNGFESPDLLKIAFSILKEEGFDVVEITIDERHLLVMWPTD